MQSGNDYTLGITVTNVTSIIGYQLQNQKHQRIFGWVKMANTHDGSCIGDRETMVAV